MIDQDPDGRYIVVGNKRTFESLNDVVRYHRQHKVVATDPVCLVEPCGAEGGNDLASLELKPSTRSK